MRVSVFRGEHVDCHRQASLMHSHLCTGVRPPNPERRPPFAGTPDARGLPGHPPVRLNEKRRPNPAEITSRNERTPRLMTRDAAKSCRYGTTVNYAKMRIICGNLAEENRDSLLQIRCAVFPLISLESKSLINRDSRSDLQSLFIRLACFCVFSAENACFDRM